MDGLVLKSTQYLDMEGIMFHKEEDYYSVVIIKENGDIISRAHSPDLSKSEDHAKSRRLDFPTAKEIRVVNTTGVISSF